MIEIKRKIGYSAFGFNILSEFPLPEVHKANLEVEPDIIIEKRDLSKQWSLMSVKPGKYIIGDNEVMFKVADSAIFSIKDGNQIFVSPILGSDVNKIRLFILGTCMAIILMQRKIIPLHGSAVVIDGKAYAFVGNRGAGKSTLASAFLGEGYKILTDDIIPVSMDKINNPYVIPSYPQQKLWQESLLEFGLDADCFQPLFERETKYAIPIGKEFYSESLPLGGIFELVKSNETNFLSMTPIRGLERLHVLYLHTFRQFLINKIGLREWHFETIARFAQKIDMFQIQRPAFVFTANQLVNMVLETIKKEEK